MITYAAGSWAELAAIHDELEAVLDVAVSAVGVQVLVELADGARTAWTRVVDVTAACGRWVSGVVRKAVGASAGWVRRHISISGRFKFELGARGAGNPALGSA
ncbi:hypothetical protein Vau01_122660 [Virgisporangium aurantiacum]|uniref:Uncharacterized protein n=1 Tax=Virgisporangium aurantiacum TaxID=175570 RepID=A0A8J4E746_9ACTN|nr:hypothetical protein Vau01_122660 [Virgisporangium aurantiacum]